MDQLMMVSRKPTRALALVLVFGLVSGCEEGPNMDFLKPKDAATQTASTPSKSTKLIERDVEAPDVFQVTEAGLWDGRPSLGGVWVAHPNVTDPQRVIIRNSSNGKFVIGALFRREREIPGPRIQASSDAAVALGMLAGAPVELNVTALVREATPEQEAIPTVIETTEAADTDTSTETRISDTAIAETKLDPIAGAAAAIDAASPDQALVAQVTAATAPKAGSKPPSKPKPKPKSSSLAKPYIQIGIFSVKANANQAANQMRSAGMVPTVFEQSSNGKAFWRVVVGPVQSKSEGNALLKKVKATGFSDAYFVTN